MCVYIILIYVYMTCIYYISIYIYVYVVFDVYGLLCLHVCLFITCVQCLGSFRYPRTGVTDDCGPLCG